MFKNGQETQLNDEGHLRLLWPKMVQRQKGHGMIKVSGEKWEFYFIRLYI